MAVDKLVDSTQLDTDLTTVANAIRTKGGTSAQLSFPNGMAQAIADIPSGGIDNLQYATSWRSIFNGATGLPETMNFVIPNGSTLFDMYAFFANTSSCKYVNLSNLSNRTLNLSYAFNTLRDVEILSFGEGNLITATDFNAFCNFSPKLKEIIGVIDFSLLTSMPGNFMINNNGALQEVRFKQNSAAVWNYICFTNAPNISDETLVSTANAFKEGTTNTWNILNKFGGRLNTIMGTVAMDETNTYHIFAADENGDTTLANFITQTKGWTLA